MKEQRRVAAFVASNDLRSPPGFRLLDLVAEVGELAKDANESTGYGDSPDEIWIAPDEIGDALFALLALAESLDVDADDALDAAIEKYEERLAETGDPSSTGDDQP